MLNRFTNRIYDLNFKLAINESFFIFFFFTLQNNYYSLLRKENFKITYFTDPLFDIVEQNSNKQSEVYTFYNFYKGEIFSLPTIFNSSLKLSISNDVNVNSCLAYQSVYYSHYYLDCNIKYYYNNWIHLFYKTLPLILIHYKWLHKIIIKSIYPLLVINKRFVLRSIVNKLFYFRFI